MEALSYSELTDVTLALTDGHPSFFHNPVTDAKAIVCLNRKAGSTSLCLLLTKAGLEPSSSEARTLQCLRGNSTLDATAAAILLPL